MGPVVGLEQWRTPWWWMTQRSSSRTWPSRSRGAGTARPISRCCMRNRNWPTGIGGALYSLIHSLIRVDRWYRDVKPPELKARCAAWQRLRMRRWYRDSCAAARPSGRSASHRNDGSGEWHVISGKVVALPVYRVAILARAGGSAWPAGPAYEARAIPAGAPGHRHTASRRAKRRVARVPRRGAHRVWPHPHGVHGTPGGPAGAVRRSTRF